MNHRMGLGDAALIKDNHVAAAGGVTAAFRAVLAAAPGRVAAPPTSGTPHSAAPAAADDSPVPRPDATAVRRAVLVISTFACSALASTIPDALNACRSAEPPMMSVSSAPS